VKTPTIAAQLLYQYGQFFESMSRAGSIFWINIAELTPQESFLIAIGHPPTARDVHAMSAYRQALCIAAMLT
jgi:hypothetical protein